MMYSYFSKNKVVILSIFLVSLSSLIAGGALLHPGLPPTHDGEYHIVRFYEFNKVLQEGSLYPRWAPDFNQGYGIPLFNYVYPLPNYIASFLHSFQLSFIDIFKLEMFLGLLLGGIFFYFWSREFWGNLGGITSAIFYTFSPYYFVDIYIRGSVGEVLALAFFPAFLWSLTKFIKYRKKIFFLSSFLFLSLLIFSHNILALMFVSFGIIYAFFLILTEGRLKKILFIHLFFILALGFSLSAVFWVPALLEARYVKGLQIFDISSNFPEFYQLIIPSWGSGFSGGNLQNQMSFQIGIANLIAVFISFITVFILFRKKDKNAKLIVFFLAWFFIILFFMLKTSLFIWQKVPFMNYFQFPWRFLSLEILVASFTAGSIIYFYKLKVLMIFLILTAFCLGIGYMKPAYYLYRNDNYYFTRPNFIEGTNSPGNIFNTIWINPPSERPKAKLIFLKGKGIIEKANTKSTAYVFTTAIKEDSIIVVNTAYFPGWTLFIDGRKEKIENLNGLISFFVPSGKHIVKLAFGETLIRKISDSISVTAALLVLLFFLKILFSRRKTC